MARWWRQSQRRSLAPSLRVSGAFVLALGSGATPSGGPASAGARQDTGDAWVGCACACCSAAAVDGTQRNHPRDLPQSSLAAVWGVRLERVTRVALNVRSASCTPAEGAHPFRPFAFPRQADPFTPVLRRNKGTVKEGDGPVELAVEVRLRQQCPPDARPYALLASALESSPCRSLARHIHRAALASGSQ